MDKHVDIVVRQNDLHLVSNEVQDGNDTSMSSCVHRNYVHLVSNEVQESNDASSRSMPFLGHNEKYLL